MARTKYAYVPFTPGATPQSDAKRQWPVDLAGRPAGYLLITLDGSEPVARCKETSIGRYAQRITRREAESAFGREWVEEDLHIAKLGGRD